MPKAPAYPVIRALEGEPRGLYAGAVAINTLRAAGHTNIAAGLREMTYDSFRRPLDLLGLS
ncbi:chorismate-binding protein [Streptomyces lacrimifluminis]|uniref:chorismate-binding protein n=1 Tax=Streptomyces lacrimifluminis TaxID=1500077 RepID=UPI001664582F|nr:chorismate-binding protein [Streptomyces lacrimifluminis]